MFFLQKEEKAVLDTFKSCLTRDTHYFLGVANKLDLTECRVHFLHVVASSPRRNFNCIFQRGWEKPGQSRWNEKTVGQYTEMPDQSTTYWKTWITRVKEANSRSLGKSACSVLCVYVKQ